MQEFFQRYLDKLDVTTVLENLLTKVISLLLLILLFYIAKSSSMLPYERLLNLHLSFQIVMQVDKRPFLVCLKTFLTTHFISF